MYFRKYFTHIIKFSKYIYIYFNLKEKCVIFYDFFISYLLCVCGNFVYLEIY